MRRQFKSNNLIAIVIAILLMIIGFTLGFMNKQQESSREQTPRLQTSLTHGPSSPTPHSGEASV